MTPLDEAIIANDLLPSSQQRTNQEIADEFSTSEASVRRHRAKLKRRGAPDQGRDAFFNDVPVDAIVQRGKTIRLPDGSYEKITWKPGAVEMAEARRFSYDDLLPVFDREPETWERDPLAPEKHAVLCLADLQLGKTGSRGGTAETVARVRSAVRSFKASIQEGGLSTLVLADVGDITEGFWNVSSQAQTNDIALTTQIRVAQRLFAETVAELAPFCGRMICVSVPSNHCQVRAGLGNRNRANAPYDDFGLMISENAEDVVAGRPGFEHVEFVRPLPREESVTVDVGSTSVGFTHGHLAGQQSKVGTWFKGQAFGRCSGLERAHVLVHGHWHNFGVSQVGDGRWVISCPSADRGSDWWTNISGDSTASSVLSFEVKNGSALAWRLW